MMECEEEEIAEGYMEILKQFGYVAMFSQVFPLAGPLAFVERLMALGIATIKFEVKRLSLISIFCDIFILSFHRNLFYQK